MFSVILPPVNVARKDIILQVYIAASYCSVNSEVLGTSSELTVWLCDNALFSTWLLRNYKMLEDETLRTTAVCGMMACTYFLSDLNFWPWQQIAYEVMDMRLIQQHQAGRMLPGCYTRLFQQCCCSTPSATWHEQNLHWAHQWLSQLTCLCIC